MDLTRELPVKNTDITATIRVLDESDAAMLVEFCQEAEDEDTAIIRASTAREALEYVRGGNAGDKCSDRNLLWDAKKWTDTQSERRAYITIRDGGIQDYENNRPYRWYELGIIA